ncbi:MAG: MaoC/PaaZ C-terminal domain-containing protein [Rhodoblastus sp.]
MALDYQKLKNWPLPDVRQKIEPKDTMLYALGLGLGADPMDRKQLRFVYEQDLLALPTMAVVVAPLGFWMKDPAVGVDWKKLLHGEQGLVLHKPIPAEGEVIGRSRILEIVDKGKDKGALAFIERTIEDARTGELIATLNSTSFLRGDGGFGGPTGPTPAPHKLPERTPDKVCDLPTAPGQALIYRLSGDYNPLHADPDVAATAGFKQPILHGLCSLGVAGHAVLKTYCDYDPTRLAALKLRFSSPVYPGETIRTEMWSDGKDISFRARVVERDKVVLDNGLAELR